MAVYGAHVSSSIQSQDESPPRWEARRCIAWTHANLRNLEFCPVFRYYSIFNTLLYRTFFGGYTPACRWAPPTRDTCRDDVGRYELAGQTSKLSPSSPPRLAAHSVCRRCNDLWPPHRRRAFRAPPCTRCTTTVCAPLRGARRQSDPWVRCDR